MSDVNIRNAQSAVLKGYSRFQVFLEKFMNQWTQPIQDVALIRMWDNMDPGMKALLKAQDPEKFNQVDKAIKGLRGEQ